MLSKKEFTNGADSGTVINLYRDTATALLGSTRELRYDKLEWSDAQFERLGEALCYCGALETLVVVRMDLSDAAAAAVVAGLASCTSLQTLNLYECRFLTALPDLSALTSLKTLNLKGCRSLTALPDLSALTSLQALSLLLCGGQFGGFLPDSGEDESGTEDDRQGARDADRDMAGVVERLFDESVEERSQGRPHEAIRLLREVLDLDPAYELAAQELQVLQARGTQGALTGDGPQTRTNQLYDDHSRAHILQRLRRLHRVDEHLSAAEGGSV